MTAPEPASVLSVDALRIAFSARDDAPAAVDGVGFELRAGRILALVGESGSGKSATAMSVLGLLPSGAQVSGSIRLEGEELIGAPVSRMRDVRGGRIGTIFQEPMTAFTPAYTIGWQIAEAIRAHDARIPRARLTARIHELLGSVGLREPDRVARSFPHQLSGGQLQRAMIAMAISCDPVALIADEPTTALDVTVQAGILELLRRLRDERGTAVLLITHDMGVVADLADEVVVLRQGAVVEAAPVAELFAAPREEYTRELLEAVPRLDRLELTDRPGPAEHVEHGAPAAEVSDGYVVYGGGWGRRAVAAVEAASFRIPRGATFGLVGESGSGKSTLGRAFAGLVPLRSGTITVAGVELSHASGRSLRELRRTIGYVFQDPASSLNPRSTVGDAIGEPLRLHTRMSRAERRARATELLDSVRLPASYVDRFPHELSGGQRQRVAIARAIALEPELLIADEPTSALDVSVQARVLELLSELQERLGFACLFISHDLAVVQDLADDVAVMRQGRIVETGPASRVLTAPSDPYTRRLLAAAPVADPDEQRLRREAWRALVADAEAAA
jgi:peptide/nickel transport system ATP-binding protein